MEILNGLRVTFPVSGVETYVFVPPLVAFVVSFFTSMAGVSGAFLILPFQMSVLGFTSPSVSSTNFLYNLVGIPAGVYKYAREGRMLWSLVGTIVLGTVPGVLIGYVVRMLYLPEPRRFKLFVGVVLLYIGYRLVRSILKARQKGHTTANFPKLSNIRVTLKRVSFVFNERQCQFSVPWGFSVSFLVGIVGGIYGIGGGAIISPFLVSVLELPVYVVSGAVLMGTFSTSVFGLAFYSFLPLKGGTTAPPDWALGVLFGLGGLAGMYLGARTQKHMPEKAIKGILASVIFIVAGKYILQIFR